MFQRRKIENQSLKPTNPDTLVRFAQVSLFPSVRGLSFQLRENNWVVLEGPDSLGIALFCDLCFGYLEPDSGQIETRLASRDVAFLGRGSTTYGRTLLEQLCSGTQSQGKERLIQVAEACLGNSLSSQLPADLPPPLRYDVAIHDLRLREKEILEISEANALLQNRRALVIDTCSSFYQNALRQGFRHSPALLQGSASIFWITDARLPYPLDAQPWNDAPKYKKAISTSLYFSLALRGAEIN